MIDGITTRQTCFRCVNDSSIPGISFNLKGLCVYCEEYEKVGHLINNYEAMKKLWLERIEKHKGKGEYDALVGLSGGKDSTNVLFQLKNTYGLKVKAWTLDQGFLTKWSKERIESIVSELGVDHEYTVLKQEDLAPLYQLSIMVTGSQCITCSYVMYGSFIKTASNQGIPMAVHGRSRPQMLKIYNSQNHNDPYKPFLEMSLTPLSEVDLSISYGKVVDILKNSLPSNEIEKFMKFFPDYTSNSVAEFIPFYLYHPYDETKIVEFLEAHMNWKRHEDYEVFTHFDCSAHDAAGYLSQLSDGRPFIMPEMSVSIREGKISRSDAITRMKKEIFEKIPLDSMKILSEYIGKSERSLILNAKRIARRKNQILSKK